jgi:hypothetical protein
MVEEETKLGNSVVRSDDGRYYSVKMPSYLQKIKRQNISFQDTVDTVSQNARQDYGFAIDNNTTLRFMDGVKEDWGNAQGLQKKIPFYGGIVAMSENLDLVESARHIQDKDYANAYNAELRSLVGVPEENIPDFMRSYDSFSQEMLKKDKKAISDYLKYIAKDKTAMYKVERGVSVLPTWMAEFAMTGGLASLGDDVAVKAGEKILGAYAKTTAGKLALKTAGWSGGALTRSFGLSHKIGEHATQQVLDEVLGLKEETGWATKLMRAWGDVYIESLSEEAGEGLTKGAGFLIGKLPFGSQATEALRKTWMSVTGGTKGEFLRKMSTKAGYSNILAEVGEERLGTTLRAIANVDDFGTGANSTMLDRLKAGWTQDVENIFVELGVLSVPAGAQFIGGKIISRDKIDQIREELGVKTEEIKAQVESVKGIQGQIETEIEGEETTETKDSIQPTPQAGAETPVKPTRVKDANLNNEVDNVVGQLVTNKADPSKTSLRQEDVDKHRKTLGLDGVPSEGRKTQLEALQQAKDGGFVEEAEANADRALNGGEQLNRLEAAGALVRMTQIEQRYNEVRALLEKATEPTAIASLSEELTRLEGRFSALTMAIHRSGSEAGRRLQMQKLTIDENYDLLSVKTRAKSKRGKELTKKQTEKFEKLTKELEQAQLEIDRLTREVSEMMSNNFLKKGSTARYKDMNKAQIESERASLTSQIQQLLDEGC